MKIVLISDTHGVVDKNIIKVIEDADLCLHAGDLGGALVVHQVAATGTPLIAVRGNNDITSKWPDDDQRLLRQLPFEQRIQLPGGDVYVEHGHKISPVQMRHQKLREKYPDAKAIIYGHSHRMVKDQHIKPWILNPGAAGRVRTFGGASCMILTIATNYRWNVKICRYEIDKNQCKKPGTNKIFYLH